MAKLIKISDKVYEYLKKEQKRLSREKLRHVPFSEVIAYLIKKDIDRIELTVKDEERKVKALEKQVELANKKLGLEIRKNMFEALLGKKPEE